MLAGLALIYVPILLFVVAFLYETYLSFARLANTSKGRRHYVDSTWEVTHTFLIFGVVMMLMLYTDYIDGIAAAIFVPTFLAACALLARAVLYIYVFYISNNKHPGVADWLFASSHVIAALFLVIVVVLYSLFLYTNQPVANTEFIPPFLIGLVVILVLITPPILYLYFGKGKK